MGVVVGTAFLAGILAKAAHSMRQRKNVASENKRNELAAEETPVPEQKQSAKK
jgi:hypothetical protein